MSNLDKMKAQLRQQRIGSANPNWKGGRARTSDGYWSVPETPAKSKGGKRRLEHRVKAKARKGQKTHHVDHNRGNNAPSNLQNKTKHPGVGGK
jgi:hypothetical protein